MQDASVAKDGTANAAPDAAEEDAPRTDDETHTVLQALGATACSSNSDFQCASAELPLDHNDPDGRKFTWSFAVRPADVSPPSGMLITIVGGPGDEGLTQLDDYRNIDRRIRRELDLVYFDLRGVGGSGQFDCDRAMGRMLSAGTHVGDEGQETTLRDKATAFASQCLTEIGLSEQDAALYNTLQAAHDLEWLRKTLNYAKIRMYGLSYGTQLAQTYAHQYPTRVERMVIDGVIDLTLDMTAFDASLARNAQTILETTLQDCNDNTACRNAMGGDANTAWNDALEALPRSLQYSVSGSNRTWNFTRADLDTATFSYITDPSSRATFLNALASITTDDWQPMLDLFFYASGIDGDSQAYYAAESLTPYYLITCADYGAPDLDAYFAAGRELWSQALTSPFYGDSPCAAWPVQERISPLVSTLNVPMLIINSTGDAATPHEQGEAVAARNPSAGVIRVNGGKHVMYGFGNDCVDEAANAFLLDGTLPSGGTEECDEEWVSR